MTDPKHTGANKPDFPTKCRTCGGILDRIDDYPLTFDMFSGRVRTHKYTYACRKNYNHPRLVVLDNPDADYRVVIREDKYDRERERQRGGKSRF